MFSFARHLGFLSLFSLLLLLLTAPSPLGWRRQASAAGAVSAIAVVSDGGRRDGGAISVSGSLLPPRRQRRVPNVFDPFFPILQQKNNTKREELMSLLLKKRRLQQEEAGNPTPGRNFTDVINDLFTGVDTNETEDTTSNTSGSSSSSSESETGAAQPSGAMGCNICRNESNTLLADNIPNINWEAYEVGLADEVGNLTCLEWQEYALPTFVPSENCPSDSTVMTLFSLCCKMPIPRYQCEQNIHNHVIGGNDNYNTAVPPSGDIGPITIDTEVFFNYAEGIDVEAGTASIMVTISLSWKDPRLAWNVDGDLCADYINVWAGYDPEVTAIWVPDFDLLNMKQGVQDFPNQQAIVYSDGTVSWVRSGPITAMCQFVGLAAIPYDTLGCQFLFGGKSRGEANAIAYKLWDEETMISGAYEMIYNEFLPVPEMFEKGYTWYYNLDHATGIFYNFYFQRAKDHYVSNLVVPTIVLTYCSFLVYLLDMRIGERLGFGMALALVVVAQQIVTITLIPVSNKKLWIDKFIGWSFFWVLLGLIQSVAMGFLYYLREDHDTKMAARRHSNMKDESREDMMVEELETKAVVDGSNEKKEKWIYTFRLRKLDYICLLFAGATYTIFIIVMFATNANNSWEKNDPTWMTESSLLNPVITNSSDPYSRR